MIPEYLRIPAGNFGQEQPVKVRVLGDMASIAQDFAEELHREIVETAQANRTFTAIIPVGPVDQFPLLAKKINGQRTNCHHVLFINMDEYLTHDDQWIPIDHPLSFRGYMNRAFYDLLDPELAPPEVNRIFPDPNQPEAIGELIARRGGLDACYGGIGINGHIAFNEPPEPEKIVANEDFATLPTRALTLTRETRTINSVTVGGGLEVIPYRAVTVGMKEILSARKLRFYCNRPWQSAVARRVLHGPLSSACPASFLRTHPDAQLTVADYVARPPDIQLR